jgi:iron complex outermembrane receptor protein
MEKLMSKNMLKSSASVRGALIVVVGSLFLIVSNAFAQNPSPAPAGGGQAEVERVIVTGSNIPTAEEVGPNPVDTYRRDDITRLGVRTTTDLVQKLPAATGATISDNNTNGGNGSTRISLRGIDPKETLVLQDGRRLAIAGDAAETFSSVDFNIFPLGLIDHIDILKDGASPIYGADAVSGVVNVYLIHRFRGVELYASYGNTNLGFAGDRAEEAAYVLAGTGDEKTDIVVYAGYSNAAAIFSRDIDVSHDADHTPFGGNDVRSGNFAGRVGGFQFSPKNNPAAAGFKTPTPHAFADPASDPQYQPRSNAGLRPGVTPLSREQLAFNFADLTPEVAPTDREYFYGSVIRDICDKYLTVFADFKYARTFWDGGLAPTPITPDVFTDATHAFGISAAGFSVPTQNAFNPFTVGNYTSPGGFDPRFPNTQASAASPGTEFTTGVRYRTLEAGLRTTKNLTENYLFTGGLKGNLGEFGDYLKTWEWETGFRYNEDYRIQRTGGLINSSALRLALLDTNPATAFNPFGLNQNNKFVADKVFVTATHLAASTVTIEDAKLNGDLFSLPAGPVSFAIGGEHRTEHLSDNPDALTASGQTKGATNFAATKGSRDVWATYWELRVPVTSPTWHVPGLYSLELDYAERYEFYSDFGNTERPKFSVRWQPLNPAITLRASYIEAFHAPSLAELFAGTAQAFPNVNDPQSGKVSPQNPSGGTTGTEPQVQQNIEGNPTLRPEVAYEWTYGGVITFDKLWSGLQGLTVSVDNIHIDLRDYITALDPQFVIDHESIFGTGTVPGSATSTFIQRGLPGSNGGTSPTLGPILVVNTPLINVGRFIEDAIDYEMVYTLQTSRFGHGDLGALTATFNGTYLYDADVVAVPGISPRTEVSGKFGGGFQGPNGGGSFTHNRWYSSLFYDGPEGSWLGGLDTGASVHYVGQYWDTKGFEAPPNTANRKIREWVTLDLIMNYTFSLPAPAAQSEVAGYAKDGGKNVKMKDGKDKNVMPVSTAEYNPCGWRAWLNNTTVTLGMNNVTDEQPPFVAAAFENGFDEQTANAKGRTWYVALKKRF